MPLILRKNRKVVDIPIVQIRPCRTQARKNYNTEEMKELALSIKNNGVIQPITVRKVSSVEYELIAGERRLRASVMCGRKRIPCIVISCTDSEAERFSLEENLKRSDLNFFEEAQGIAGFMNSSHISSREAARQFGKKTAEIIDLMNVLRLDNEEKSLILKAHLTERHATALLKVRDKTERRIVLSEIIEMSMNVSQTETYIDSYLCMTAREKLRSQRKKGVIRDIRFFENTIKKSLAALNASGIEAETKLSETEDHLEYVIRVPKLRTAEKNTSGTVPVPPTPLTLPAAE